MTEKYTTEYLVKIIRNNPGCVISVHYADWTIHRLPLRKSLDEMDKDEINHWVDTHELACSEYEHCRDGDEGGGVYLEIVKALAVIAGATVEEIPGI